jgi:hypothetical protein
MRQLLPHLLSLLRASDRTNFTNQKIMIAHEILHVVSSQDNRSPTATRLTERKRNGDDRTCFTISGFLRSDWPMLSTKRRPVHQRQLSQAPLMCVIQPAQLSLTNLWTAVTLVHAIVPSPQRKRTQECCRRRCGEGDCRCVAESSSARQSLKQRLLPK